MTDQELAARLREVLAAAQRRYRLERARRNGVLGALTSLPVPVGLLDEIAVGSVPVLRLLVREAVEAHFEEQEPRYSAIVEVDDPATMRRARALGMFD